MPMSAAQTEPRAIDSSPDVYQLLENYDWDSDEEFQGGLRAILGTNASEEQAAELTLRARCFYYSK